MEDNTIRKRKMEQGGEATTRTVAEGTRLKSEAKSKSSRSPLTITHLRGGESNVANQGTKRFRKPSKKGKT